MNMHFSENELTIRYILDEGYIKQIILNPSPGSITFRKSLFSWSFYRKGITAHIEFLS